MKITNAFFIDPKKKYFSLKAQINFSGLSPINSRRRRRRRSGHGPQLRRTQISPSTSRAQLSSKRFAQRLPGQIRFMLNIEQQFELILI